MGPPRSSGPKTSTCVIDPIGTPARTKEEAEAVMTKQLQLRHACHASFSKLLINLRRPTLYVQISTPNNREPSWGPTSALRDNLQQSGGITPSLGTPMKTRSRVTFKLHCALGFNRSRRANQVWRTRSTWRVKSEEMCKQVAAQILPRSLIVNKSNITFTFHSALYFNPQLGPQRTANHS